MDNKIELKISAQQLQKNLQQTEVSKLEKRFEFKGNKAPKDDCNSYTDDQSGLTVTVCG